MAKAVWNGAVLAESDTYERVDGYTYFPRDAVNWAYFEDSEHHSTCFWKGVASYYDIKVDGQTNESAAWYYPEPSEAATKITDHVGFWKSIQVET